jgi:MATE family multidrug resistance protein
VTALIDKAAFTMRPAGHPALAEARALAALAAPLVLTQLAQMGVLTTDVILLGRFGRSALAAAAIGNTVYYFAWLIGSGPVFAVAPIIAQILGERPGARGAVRAAVRMGLWSAIIVGTPMILLLWQAAPILRAFHQDPALAASAGVFVGAVSLGLPFSLGYGALRSFTTAVGRPHAGLWVMAATVAFNALAGWTLIFGHFGAPRLGILGSGMATAASSVFSFLAMVLVIRLSPDLNAYRPFRRFARPALEKLAEIFRLGLPMGMAMIFEAMLFNAMTLVMGTFGTAPLAAHQIALSFASLTFMVPLGLGMAATVRVGLFAGAGDIAGARRAGFTALVMGEGFIVLCGAAMYLFGSAIAGLYVGGRAAQDLQVIALTAVFLKVAGAFQVFDAGQVVAAQSLRGLKDARAPMWIAGASYWLVGAPTCIGLGFGLGLQGLGVWIGLAVGLAAAAVLLLARFMRLTRPGRA